MKYIFESKISKVQRMRNDIRTLICVFKIDTALFLRCLLFARKQLPENRMRLKTQLITMVCVTRGEKPFVLLLRTDTKFGTSINAGHTNRIKTRSDKRIGKIKQEIIAFLVHWWCALRWDMMKMNQIMKNTQKIPYVYTYLTHIHLCPIQPILFVRDVSFVCAADHLACPILYWFFMKNVCSFFTFDANSLSTATQNERIQNCGSN